MIADVLPSDRARTIKELQTAGKVVAMVGDGERRPALATADIGIAIGFRAPTWPGETGGIILVRSDVRDVVAGIRLSPRDDAHDQTRTCSGPLSTTASAYRLPRSAT